MTQPPRSRQQRIDDTLRRLDDDVDAWIATASVEGIPYMIPLSFLWDSETLVISTPGSSPTSRNLEVTGKVRVGVGPTRDLVLIEGTAKPLEEDDISAELGDAFAKKTGFDPRELATPYRYFRIQPVRIQAWREADELTGRDLMRNGKWLSAV
jgi:nitroimidazol reductase NimA-like FMN-containing flavoprotein (pyridoxamine 5'-phosphate oxidase superfamily)